MFGLCSAFYLQFRECYLQVGTRIPLSGGLTISCVRNFFEGSLNIPSLRILKNTANLPFWICEKVDRIALLMHTLPYPNKLIKHITPTNSE